MSTCQSLTIEMYVEMWARELLMNSKHFAFDRECRQLSRPHNTLPGQDKDHQFLQSANTQGYLSKVFFSMIRILVIHILCIHILLCFFCLLSVLIYHVMVEVFFFFWFPIFEGFLLLSGTCQVMEIRCRL